MRRAWSRRISRSARAAPRRIDRLVRNMHCAVGVGERPSFLAPRRCGQQNVSQRGGFGEKDVLDDDHDVSPVPGDLHRALLGGRFDAVGEPEGCHVAAITRLKASQTGRIPVGTSPGGADVTEKGVAAISGGVE
jgi:hypothetical protein